MHSRIEVGNGHGKVAVRVCSDGLRGLDQGCNIHVATLVVVVRPLHVVASGGTIHAQGGGDNGVRVHLERQPEEEGNNEVELRNRQHLER